MADETKAKDVKAAPDKAVVQEKVDAENEQGFRGYNPDPTPNEHYTFEGAAAGKPTPETDPEMAAKAGRPRERVITAVPTNKER
jgi:hypothetical protein